MEEERKKLAIVFWSAFYLPALQIFLLALIDGIGKWTIGLSLLFIILNVFVFKPHTHFQKLSTRSRFIACVIFPVAILLALVGHYMVVIRFWPTFLVYATLTVIAAYSCFDILKTSKSN